MTSSTLNGTQTSPTPETSQISPLAQIAAEKVQQLLAKLPILGPITWLMMNNPATRHAFLADMEWRIMPPLLCNQSKLYLNGNMPTAYVSWAYLSEEVITRFTKPPYHLAPGDWQSGSQLYLIDMITPYGGTQEVLDDLKKTSFVGKTIHQFLPVGLEGGHTITL